MSEDRRTQKREQEESPRRFGKAAREDHANAADDLPLHEQFRRAFYERFGLGCSFGVFTQPK